MSIDSNISEKAKLKNYKEKTHQSLMNLYTGEGLEKTISIAYQMLELRDFKSNKIFQAEVHGEICETILECLILNFKAKNPKATKDWFYSKGMILKDINNPDNGFFTELDFTLFTPKRIYCFECKSYGGQKTLTNQCTVNRLKLAKKDVYKQHHNHFKVLSTTIGKLRNILENDVDYKPYKLGYFDFSLGSVNDKREDKWQRSFPYLNVDNFYSVFRDYKNIPEYWDIRSLRQAVDIIDKNKEKLTAKHLSYVKSLHK